MVVQLVLHDLQVGGAEGDVGVEVIHLAVVVVLEADFLRHPARGGGHQLHQAGGTGH